MKNKLLAIALFFAAKMLSAQAPQQINYQAVIRDNTGQILTDTTVFLEFTITQNSATVSYEKDTIHTTPYGLANTLIGDDAPGFPNIDWFAGPLQFNVAFSLDNLTFEPVGGAQSLSSVPFALAAETAKKLAGPVTTVEILNGSILPEDLAPVLLEKQWKADSLGNIFRDTLNVSIGGSDFPTLGKLNLRGGAENYAALYSKAGDAPFAGFFEGKLYTYGDATATGLGTFENGLQVYGNTSVSGKGTFSNGLSVFGDGAFNSNLNVSSNANVGNDLTVGNILTLTGSTDYQLDAWGGDFYIRQGGQTFLRNGKGIVSGGNTFPDQRYIIPGDTANSFLGLTDYRWKQIWCEDGSINTSDARLKTNIEKIPYGIDAVMKMNPVRYNWKKDPRGKLMTGFLAQELETIVPEAVVNPADAPRVANANTEEPAYYGVNYSNLIPVLAKAIQEQQAIISGLQTRLEKLEQH